MGAARRVELAEVLREQAARWAELGAYLHVAEGEAQLALEQVNNALCLWGLVECLDKFEADRVSFSLSWLYSKVLTFK
jgi:hypothetical protein